MPVLTTIARAAGVRRTRLLALPLCALPLIALATAPAAPPTVTAALDPQLWHAYALAELGRHSAAMEALEEFKAKDGGALELERSAYHAALQFTQNCTQEQPCMAEDLLAIGRLPEALSAQKQRMKAIRDQQKSNLRKGESHSVAGLRVELKDETDSTGGRSVELADAFDLQARIEAAIGQRGRALKDLDSALHALPQNPKTAPRAASYAYHRALILAEDRQFPEAAKACQVSLHDDDSTAVLGERRHELCNTITNLASAPLR